LTKGKKCEKGFDEKGISAAAATTTGDIVDRIECSVWVVDKGAIYTKCSNVVSNAWCVCVSLFF